MTAIVRNELQPGTMSEELGQAVGRGPLWVEYTGEDDEYIRFEGSGLPHRVFFLGGWIRQDEGISAGTFLEINQPQAAITVEREFGSAPAPFLVASVSLETGLVLSWETTVYNLVPEANEDVVFTFSEPEGRLYDLAREFGISLGLVQAVWRIIAAYVDEHPNLTLTVERLVEPEAGDPLEIVFEVRGTRSSEETTQIWEELEALVEGAATSDEENEALLSKIGVHVHRGAAKPIQSSLLP